MDDLSKVKASNADSYWVAYYPDWSGQVGFRSEVKALRAAVEMSGHVVKCPFGVDAREWVQELRRRESGAADDLIYEAGSVAVVDALSEPPERSDG